MDSPDGSATNLKSVVERLLRVHEMPGAIPVIVSSIGRRRGASVGCLIHRNGSVALLQVDHSVSIGKAVTVFLPGRTYLGEVTSCKPCQEQFSVEVALIQARRG